MVYLEHVIPNHDVKWKRTIAESTNNFNPGSWQPVLHVPCVFGDTVDGAIEMTLKTTAMMPPAKSIQKGQATSEFDHVTHFFFQREAMRLVLFMTAGSRSRLIVNHVFYDYFVIRPLSLQYYFFMSSLLSLFIFFFKQLAQMRPSKVDK